MSRPRRSLAVALLLALTGPGSVWAQAWDTPSFFSPRSHDDLGLYGFVPEHGDWALAAIWRQSGRLNLGVRAGVGDRLVLLGAEFYGPLQLPESPLLLAWQVGFGAGFDDVTLLRIPAGLSAGFDLGTRGGPQLTPYVFPRLALELAAWNEGDQERTHTDLAFALDLGADLNLTPDLILRAGATIADRNAIGVGVAYRLQRRILVR